MSNQETLSKILPISAFRAQIIRTVTKIRRSKRSKATLISGAPLVKRKLFMNARILQEYVLEAHRVQKVTVVCDVRCVTRNANTLI